MNTGIELIAEERAEQLGKHNRTIEDDVLYNDSTELVRAAMGLAFTGHFTFEQLESPLIQAHLLDLRLRSKPVKWGIEIWENMCNKTYVERLAIAGALIAAEIDRVQFLTNGSKPA